ncbi:MAG: winged helix-turn-helix domain-containing protein [Proteobacteria bacterium]|nr:winged helix-turn-helix domain-containing protein [Pseudomonadota bacterium]
MGEHAATAPSRRFRVDDLEIDLDGESVRRGGVLLDLPDLSFRLLATLVRRAPERVTKDELIREVWDEVVVSDETLAQRVRLLRQVLGEDSQNPHYIASVRGRGYRLLCKVDALAPEEQTGSNRIRWALYAGIVTAAVMATWFGMNKPGDQAPSTVANTIAVLPFTDLSADQGNRHFADGMQEELLTRLTQLDNLDVLSRTSVERYRTTNLDLPEIARQIGADAVIEGSIRIADGRVRITVQLIDAVTDRHIWAENFDRELSVANIIYIQEEVAEKIAAALRLEYKSRLATTQGRLPTDDLQAYEAYLLGRYHTFQQTPRDLEQAVTDLERATALDNQFAEAYASLGWANSFLGTAYGRHAPRDAYPKARAAALRALALNGELADARSLYADILTWYDWDFVAAEREYERTMELDPLNVLGYALFLSTQRRHDEAIELVEKRVAANPNDPYVLVNAGWRYLNAGQTDRAIAAATRAQGHPDANSVLGFSSIAAGEIDRAITAFEADLDIFGSNPLQLSNLAYAYFKAGRRTEGKALLDELLATSMDAYLSPTLIAAVYFAAGDADNGFAMLDQAVAARAREVIFIQVSQMLAGHRQDPRYADLIRKIGFQ